VAAKAVKDQAVHGLGSVAMAFSELVLDSDVNRCMQLSISGVMPRALVVSTHGVEAVCFGGSQPLVWVRCDLRVISHSGDLPRPSNVKSLELLYTTA
jgi:hypothetical protein